MTHGPRQTQHGRAMGMGQGIGNLNFKPKTLNHGQMTSCPTKKHKPSLPRGDDHVGVLLGPVWQFPLSAQ